MNLVAAITAVARRFPSITCSIPILARSMPR
jgi:hypothetical protein